MLYDELQDNIQIEGQRPLPEDAIICDIDGTLSLLGDRDPIHNQADCVYDKLHHPVYRLLIKYKKAGYKIILLTGRNIQFAPETERWLKQHNVPYDLLIMRPLENRDFDYALKHQAYNEFIKNKYTVEFVLEDRSRVVEMWRSIGLTCFQVAKGDF